MSNSPAEHAPQAWILAKSGIAGVQIFGLSPEERLERSLRAAGCAHIERWTAAAHTRADGTLLLLRGDLIFDPRLIATLCATPGIALYAPIDGPGQRAVPVAAHVAADAFEATRGLLEHANSRAPLPAGVRRVEPAELAPAYIAALRKADPPYVLRARPDDVAGIESKLFGSAYKTITDLVTRWAWPVPAAAVVRVLARRRVHPNSVTLASWLLALAAIWLFAEAHFGLGLVAAWGMTFLDTVDGKLARVTLTSSRFGHVADHGLDLLHPPFWYLAWGYGVSGGVDTATAIAMLGYLVGRLLEGAFLLAFSLETHCWRPIDNLFRTITARRNPNLILLSVGALAAAPAQGMRLVALWTCVSLGFHAIRLLQAFLARARGETIAAWDEVPPRPARPRLRTDGEHAG